MRRNFNSLIESSVRVHTPRLAIRGIWLRQARHIRILEGSKAVVEQEAAVGTVSLVQMVHLTKSPDLVLYITTLSVS